MIGDIAGATGGFLARDSIGAGGSRGARRRRLGRSR